MGNNFVPFELFVVKISLRPYDVSIYAAVSACSARDAPELCLLV